MTTEGEATMPLDGTKPTEFPDVTFPVITITASIAAVFALKNPDDHAKAKRTVEAVRKLFADAGASVDIQFGEPA